MKKRALTNDERERIVDTVQDAAGSYYWQILRGVIEQWMAEESAILERFKVNGIRTESDARDYNRASDRLKYLDSFLHINETTIEYNRTILERMKEGIVDAYDKVQTFVKEAV